ncbi:RHS repeat domain-containing protein [Lonsdalea quercina]
MLDRLVGIKDAHWGEQDFRLNGNGQVTAERRNGRWRQAKLFGYDSEQNLCEVSEIMASSGVPLSVSQAVSEGQRRYDGAGRIVERGDVRYEYDVCGRLCRKREVRAGFRPKETRYEWDTQDRLRRVSLPDGARWRYGYDAFGRRVNKVREGQVASLQSVSKVQYQWDGDQLVGQVQYYADGTPAREVQWVYEPGSFRPLAQVERKGDDTRLHYVVTDLAGTARELCSETGEVHWRGEQGLWNGHREDRLPVGLKRYLGDAANEEVYCELRYQGQIYDAETGLYYNRHRYYDADSGQYISPDPIGLHGGIRPQAYVSNPLTSVDPYGLMVLYRGMSTAEYNDLMKDGVWKYGNGSMEGKWFAESYKDAVTWGNKMGHGGDTFKVVQINMPDDIANRLHADPHLDGIGPARYAELEDLNDPRTKITWTKEVKSTKKSC